MRITNSNSVVIFILVVTASIVFWNYNSVNSSDGVTVLVSSSPASSATVQTSRSAQVTTTQMRSSPVSIATRRPPRQKSSKSPPASPKPCPILFQDEARTVCTKRCSSPTNTSNSDFPCFNGGCRCPAPQCMLSRNRDVLECVESPYFLNGDQTKRDDGSSSSYDKHELVCTGLEGGDPVPSYIKPSKVAYANSSLFGFLVLPEDQDSVNISSGNTTMMMKTALAAARHHLQRFKRSTSWLFKHWVNWGHDVQYGGDDAARRQRRDEMEQHSIEANFQDELSDEEKQKQELRDSFEELSLSAAWATTSSSTSSSSSSWLHPATRSSDFVPKFVPPSNNGMMTGKHHPTTGLYHWSNVCLRSEGNPAGFRPKITQYKGKPEIESVAPRILMQGTTRFIANVDKLDQPPKLVLDMRVLLVPIDYKSENSGHVLYRAIAARRVAQRLWGPGAKFHVVYLINADNVSSDAAAKRQRDDLEGHRTFYQLVGHSWSVVFRERPTQMMRRAFDSESSERADMFHREAVAVAASSFAGLPTVCFKDIVVAQVCHHKCNEREKPGNAYQFPYMGRHAVPEHQSAIYRFRALVTSCLGVAASARRHASTNDDDDVVVVTLIARTSWRVDYGLAAAVPRIADAIDEMINSSSSKTNSNIHFQVVTQHGRSPASFLRVVLGTDILIGSMGGSLTFAFLLPRGGVLVEITGTSACSRWHPGWGINFKCEFGGMCFSRGIAHLAVTLDKASVPKALPTPGIYIGVPLYRRVVRMAICRRFLTDSSSLCSPEEMRATNFEFARWSPLVDS